MIIQSGKKYLSRSKILCRIYATGCGGSKPIHGAVYDDRIPVDPVWIVSTWDASGRFHDRKVNHSLDLVSEYVGDR